MSSNVEEALQQLLPQINKEKEEMQALRSLCSSQEARLHELEESGKTTQRALTNANDRIGLLQSAVRAKGEENRQKDARIAQLEAELARKEQLIEQGKVREDSERQLRHAAESRSLQHEQEAAALVQQAEEETSLRRGEDQQAREAAEEEAKFGASQLRQERKRRRRVEAQRDELRRDLEVERYNRQELQNQLDARPER